MFSAPMVTDVNPLVCVRFLASTGGRAWDMRREFVIRGDGLHTDLGYPASIQLQDDRILSVYYFHDTDGIRYIGGSIYTEADMGVKR